MSEQEMPKMIIETSNGDFESTPENTALFTYVGGLALYDHVFFATDHDRGIYLFNQHPNFEDVAEFMIENDFPMHINLVRVADSDKHAFNQMVHNEASDLEKGVPDEWT